jgi:phosphate transport system permease protein
MHPAKHPQHPQPAPAAQPAPPVPRRFSLSALQSFCPFPSRSLPARVIRAFFGSTALVSLLVLALITIFLFREGLPFFRASQHDLALHRHAGLEYTDILRRAETEHTALVRELSDIRLRALQHLTAKNHLAVSDANARLAAFDDFAGRFSDAIGPVRELVSDIGETATGIKTRVAVQNDKATQRQQLLDAGKTAEAAQIKIEPVDFTKEITPILDTLPACRDALRATAGELRAILADTANIVDIVGTDATATAAILPSPMSARMDTFRNHARACITTLPQIENELAHWRHDTPVPWYASIKSFFTGREWTTASFWQDWYGILPLLTGSLLASLIALALAIPLGVGAAIYISQIATAREQRLIKPAIEFISALPSVVLGFFGIAVLGELLRNISQTPWLGWLPGFPIIERLNALTAGCLLALISIPTIFTLAEDALTNVPRALREASFALGASHLQTTLRIITPAALSGIISAVLLGFGRVIGETMVVFLCAGNRIAIPDFSAGPAVVTQPVHTMTGIIAQEMGEVVRGGIHYRALFVVGIVLFILSLIINYVAQKILLRHRLPAS